MDEMGILEVREGNGKFGSPSHRWEENIRRILRTQKMKFWTGLMWLRIGKNYSFL